MLLDTMLKRLIRFGELEVVDAGGRRRRFGRPPGRRVAMRLLDRRLELELVLRPGLALGEGYMDGRIVLEEGDVAELLLLAADNVHRGFPRWDPAPWVTVAGWLLRLVNQRSRRGRSARNVAHHYDLSGELYALFLDSERQYTCAYHPTGGEGLEAAQRAKEHHIAAKLLLEPGQRVLDLGCGWGGLALHLARRHQVDVTGVTLSREQHAWANARASELGLAERARFLCRDYREVAGRFDRVVSVGLLEHVGLGRYEELFRRIKGLLAPDGVALVHSIGRMGGPSYTNAWIRKHIFPGGYIPALSEVLPPIERSGLWVTDVEVLRLHYAHTLRLWRERFLANRERAAALYDERFCRMWEFYLAASEAFFRVQDGMNFQIQLAPDRHAVPLTRDYMVDHERRHADPRPAPTPRAAA
ncbi:MAG TPA: cyclopropane-fatty-acyl-phospholipid synthase family protein [Geminicoccaceae bacterium]|nr:cyclopropane-fatty-acyl-phospholipid synthase family protein [Geminicoccaceae bacterium]